jgi:hypothetical protein
MTEKDIPDNVMQPKAPRLASLAGYDFLGGRPLCIKPNQTYPHDKNTMGPGGGH